MLVLVRSLMEGVEGIELRMYSRINLDWSCFEPAGEIVPQMREVQAASDPGIAAENIGKLAKL